jgi:hypothetical protein
MSFQHTIDPTKEIKEEINEIVDVQSTGIAQCNESEWDNSQGDLIYF